MVSASSTKRVAKLAQKSKGRRVRFQGGALFPVVTLAIIVLGVGTIVYARATVPSFDAYPPTINDHWHVAHGFELCDAEGFTQLTGDLEALNSRGQLHSTEFARTGVHSHDDGVIHWHPATSAAIGKRARLGLFLNNYGVELDDDSLTFPEDQGGKRYVEGETTCDGQRGELVVVVWNGPEDDSSGTRYVSGFNDIPIVDDGMVFTIAFLPVGTDVSMPPWAAQLPELAAADMPQPVPATSSPAGSSPEGTASTTPGSGPGSSPVIGAGPAGTPATQAAPSSSSLPSG